MLTREQIEENQTESREKGILVKNLLKEKGIPDHQLLTVTARAAFSVRSSAAF